MENNETIVVDQQEVQQGKAFAILSYFGILFLIGLLAAKENKFVQYHVNQGILLFLFNIICGIISNITIVGLIIGSIGSIFGFVLFIMGIVNSAKGEAKPLPLIGKLFTIVKSY